MNSGSFDSLKVAARCGWRAKARQTRLTVVSLRPVFAAMARVLQCVASRGIVSSVRVRSRSTSSSPTRRGAPGRGSSRKPSSRRPTKRARHFPTICSVTRKRVATTRLGAPVAHSNTMRARRASACAVFGRRAHRSRVSRSALVTTNSAFGRPVRIRHLLIAGDGCRLVHTRQPVTQIPETQAAFSEQGQQEWPRQLRPAGVEESDRGAYLLLSNGRIAQAHLRPAPERRGDAAPNRERVLSCKRQASIGETEGFGGVAAQELDQRRVSVSRREGEGQPGPLCQ